MTFCQKSQWQRGDAKARQLILADFSLRAALAGLGADPRVAANQRIHREARWSAALATETPSGGGYVGITGSRVSVDPRESKVDRADQRFSPLAASSVHYVALAPAVARGAPELAEPCVSVVFRHQRPDTI